MPCGLARDYGSTNKQTLFEDQIRAFIDFTYRVVSREIISA